MKGAPKVFVIVVLTHDLYGTGEFIVIPKTNIDILE